MKTKFMVLLSFLVLKTQTQLQIKFFFWVDENRGWGSLIFKDLLFIKAMTSSQPNNLENVLLKFIEGGFAWTFNYVLNFTLSRYTFPLDQGCQTRFH